MTLRRHAGVLIPRRPSQGWRQASRISFSLLPKAIPLEFGHPLFSFFLLRQFLPLVLPCLCKVFRSSKIFVGSKKLNRILLFAKVLKNWAQVPMFTNELKSGFRTDTLYRFKIITTKKNTQVYKLEMTTRLLMKKKIKSDIWHTWDMFISSPSRAFWRLISLMGCFFASENVRCR